MDEIKFDEPRENMKLAEEYLKNNSTFKCKGFTDSERFALNGYKNTIYYTNYKRTSGVVFLSKNVDDVPLKLSKLAKKIEENVDLFCQLEQLLRKIPSEDTKRIDLNLIVQNLMYLSTVKCNKDVKSTARQIVLGADYPLAALGYVGQALMAFMPRVVIECTRETAPVATLFTQLCHEVGLKEKVLLAILPEILEDAVTLDFKKMTDSLNGCVGVVSGKSDVDSAVDTFLAASSRYPWALKKIFVQENAVEQFTRSMTWKEEKQMENHLHKNGSEVDREVSYSFGDKTFVLRSGSDTNDRTGRVVVLEAYRTVKELLGFLAAEKPFAVSLWCSDVSETNELAHNVDANIVWVNDFADFEGPPRSSQAFFSVIDTYLSMQCIECPSELDEITKLRESWLKLHMDKRKEVVRKALERVDRSKSKKCLEDLDNITIEMDSFVYLNKNVVSTGVELSPQLMKPSPFYDDGLNLSIISHIIKGGGILLHVPQHSMAPRSGEISYVFYENLRSMGGPVLLVQKECRLGNFLVLSHPIRTIKVIWTNFGTIFAN